MFKTVLCVINHLVSWICAWLFYYKNIAEDNECFINHFTSSIAQIHEHVFKNIKSKPHENTIYYEKKNIVPYPEIH